MRTPEETKAACLRALILVALLTLPMLAIAAGCGAPPPRPKVAFENGDLVQIKLSGEKAMVLYSDLGWRGRFYACRVVGTLQQTVDGIVSRDSALVRYAEVRFYTRELESWAEGVAK